MTFPAKIWKMAILLFVTAIPVALYAHPMGNFSISHYAAIHIGRDNVELNYFVDMAEIPTYQEIQRTGIIAKEGDASIAPYLVQESAALSQGLLLEIDGKPVRLRAVNRGVLFTPGAGGLPTMKLEFVYRAEFKNLNSMAHEIHYLDTNFTGHSGWKEIVVTRGDGVALAKSSAPAVDRSSQLSNYPTDLLNSPPQDLQADIAFMISSPVSAPQVTGRRSATERVSESAVGVYTSSSGANGEGTASPIARSGAASPASLSIEQVSNSVSGSSQAEPTVHLQANKQLTPRSKFTDLVSGRQMSFWFLLSAAMIAAGLGALHALEPGHGKTIVAAYLVGSRGTPRHAILLGMIVTAAHTVGVYVLGVITLYASRWIVPERLYPWLGIISGLMIAGLAAYLFLRAWTGISEDHRHEPGELRSHWFESLVKPRFLESSTTTTLAKESQTAGMPTATIGTPTAEIPLRQLLTLGITGGMVPCPAALVVLLSALSLHRLGLGLFLIVAFSLGLAAVLIVVGLLMVYARRFMARWKGDGILAKRWLPVFSSGTMLVLGLGITVQAMLSTGIGAGFLSGGHLASIAGIVLLGFFLGMRHSTDPDHVVAVSTIVSRERSVRHAAIIGVLWGVGHTLTISVLGSAIILLGMVIPPRIGLSMEFTVAVMLILLGVLNLTGVLRWLTRRFTPAGQAARQFTLIGNAVDVATVRPRNRARQMIGRYGIYQLVRPLVIGLVHGLAGSAAVALLVLSTIRSPVWAIAYLVVFGVGTIAGMMLMTTIIAMPIVYSGNRFALAGNYLGVLSGVASTAFGIFLVYQIGLVDGLFRAQAHWTPR
jgi:ABC-type nickel/cobalt efflux system permease component RcnA